MSIDDMFKLELSRDEAQELWDILREMRSVEINRAAALRGSSLRDECEMRADYCLAIMQRIGSIEGLWLAPEKEDEREATKNG